MSLKTTFKGLLFASTALLVLQGCSSSDDEDPATLPAPLPVLESPAKTSTAWISTTSNGVEDFYSNLKPVVAYSKVYFASRGGDVFAYDKDTGEQIWQADLREEKNGFWQTFWFDEEKTARLSGGIAASYQKIYVGSEDGLMIALDEATGEEAWRTQLQGEVLAAPAVDNGMVFTQTGSGLIYALDAQSGDIKWESESEVPPLTLRGTSSPVFANGGVMVGGANGKLAVYIADSGQLAWEEAVAKPSGSTELERVVDIDSTPLVIGPLVYSLSYGGTVTAMDFRNGRVVWKREYGGFVDMTYNGNDLILVDLYSNIFSVDRRNGVEKWSNSQLLNRGITAPVIQNTRIVVGDFEGYLHWLNIETGELEAQLEVDDEGFYAAASVNNGRVYAVTRSGKLVAVDLP